MDVLQLIRSPRLIAEALQNTLENLQIAAVVDHQCAGLRIDMGTTPNHIRDNRPGPRRPRARCRGAYA